MAKYDFADDFFWWIKAQGKNPPTELQGNFVLIYGREILGADSDEDVLNRMVNDQGLKDKHYCIMAVGIEPKRPHLEIPV